MTDTVIRYSPAGHQVGLTSDGRDFHPVGPPFATPRAAIDYSDQLDAAATGPGVGAAEAPGTDADGGPRSAEPVGGRLGPSYAVPAMRGAPQLDLAGLLGPASEGEAATFRGSPEPDTLPPGPG